MAEAPVDRLRPGDHVCWTFSGEPERRAVSSAYVRAGLRAGQRVLWFTDAVGVPSARAQLRADGMDPDAAIRSGQLTVAGADDAYLGGGRFDPDRSRLLFTEEAAAARSAGWSGLRALGDMGWAARGAPGTDRLAGYERDVNRLYADGFALAICLYDRDLFGTAELAELGRAHPGTHSDRYAGAEPLLRIRRIDGGLRLTGEADVSNRDALATVLSGLRADSGPDVTLDLSGLVYADASTCALIAGLGRSGPLRITGITPAVRYVLHLFDLGGTRLVPAG